MAIQPQQEQKDGTEPRGFGSHSRGLAGEYAHEQGWGLNLEQRKHESGQPQNTDGGTEYDYGAQDLGDEPVNTKLDPQSSGRTQNKVARSSKSQE